MITKLKHNQKLLLIAAALLFLFCISTVLASSQTLFAGEARLLTAINGWSGSLKVPMLVITYLGSEFMVLAVLAVLVLKKQRRLAAYLTLMTGAAYVVAWLTKHVVARPRPDGLLSGIITRQTESGYGFPSLHVAATTVMAITLCRLLPKNYRWQVATLWIVLVALSRLYLGVHAPLDLVGGFAIGGGIALIPDFLKIFIDQPKPKTAPHK